MNSTISKPETGRITLSLQLRTIKELRLLAVVRGLNQNQVAEELFIRAGLHSDVKRKMQQGGFTEERICPVISLNATVKEPTSVPSVDPGTRLEDPGPTICVPPVVEPVECLDDAGVPW